MLFLSQHTSKFWHTTSRSPRRWLSRGVLSTALLLGTLPLAPSAIGGTLTESINASDSAAVEAQLKKDPTLLNQRDELGITPLIYAIHNGNLAMVQQLVQLGADINLSTREHGTPLQYSLMSNQPELTAWLIDQGADIHAVAEDGWTILQAVVAEEVYESAADNLQMLLDRGLSLSAKDPADNSLLHYAVALESRPLIERLLKHGADPLAENAEEYSALDWSLEREDKHLFTLLYNSVKHSLSEDQQFFLLAASLEYDRADALTLLLDAGWPVDKTQPDSPTLLQLALAAENSALARELIRRGASVLSAPESSGYEHPLTYAGWLEDPALLRAMAPELLATESTLLITDLLRYALELGDLKTIQLLQPQLTRTTFEEALTPELVDLWEESGFLKQLAQWAFDTKQEALYPGLLTLALAAGDDDFIRPLVKWQRQQKNHDSLHLMFTLIEQRQDGALPYLQELHDDSQNLNQLNPKGISLLQAAIFAHAPETARWLLELGADPAQRGLSSEEQTEAYDQFSEQYDYPLAMVLDALELADAGDTAESPWWPLLDQLLANPALLQQEERDGTPILQSALEIDQPLLTQRLIRSASKSQLEQIRIEGASVLHLLVRRADSALIQQLLDRGISATPELTDNQISPLQLAVTRETFEIADLLLNAGARPAPALYHQLYAAGHHKMLKRWIERYGQVDGPNASGDTLLLLSLRDDNWPLAYWLLTQGANPNARDHQQRSAIWLASNNLYAFNGLLKVGANPQVPGPQGRSLLHLAAEKGYKRLLGQLLNGGFDVTAQDDQGHTPIDLAINQGHFEILQALVDKLPEPQQKDANTEDVRLRHWSALYWADRKDNLLSALEKDLASAAPHPRAAYIWSTVHRRLDQLETAYNQAPAALKTQLGITPQMLITLDTHPEQVLARYPVSGDYDKREIYALLDLATEVENQQQFAAMFGYLHRVIELAPNMWQPVWFYEEMALLERKELRQLASEFANRAGIRDTLSGRYIRALLQQHGWKHSDRLPVIEQYLQQNPRDSRAWMAKSYALANNSYFQEARDAALTGTAILPFYSNRDKPVELLLKNRQPEQARRYAALVARWYGEKDLRARQARYFIEGLISTGDKGQAREELTAALKASPDNARLMFQMAKLELADKRPNEAVFWMSKGAEQKADMSQSQLRRFMDAFREAGDPAQAYAVFEQYRTPRPSANTYTSALGLLQTLKRNSAYRSLLQEALDHYPDHQALNRRALRLQWQSGEKTAALVQAEKLLALYPADSKLQTLIFEYKTEHQSPTQAQQFIEQQLLNRPWDKNLWQLAQRSLPDNRSDADRLAFWQRARQAAPYEAFACEKLIDIHVGNKSWTDAHQTLQHCLTDFEQATDQVRISNRLTLLLNSAWVYENQSKQQRLPVKTIQAAEQGWLAYKSLRGSHDNYLRYRESFCRARQDLKCAANALAERSYFSRDNTAHFHTLVAKYSQQLGAAKTRGYGAQMIARNPYDEEKLRSFLHKNLLWSGSPIVALKAIQEAKSRGLQVDKDWERKALGQLGDSLSEFEQYTGNHGGPGASLRYINWFNNARKDALNSDGTQIFYKFDSDEPAVEILLPNGEMITRRDHPLFGKPTYFAKGAGFIRLTYTDSGQLARILDSSGKSIRLEYNEEDEIVLLQTSKGEELHFEYGPLGKPTRIMLKDVGELRVRYDSSGEIVKVSSDAGHAMALRVTQAFQSLLSMVKKVQKVHNLKDLPRLDHQDETLDQLRADYNKAPYDSKEEQHAKLALASYLVENVRSSAGHFDEAESLLYELFDTAKALNDPRNQLDAAQAVRKLHQLYSTVKPHGLPRQEFSRWSDAQNWLRGVTLAQPQPELQQLLAEIDQQPLVLLRDAHWLQRSDFSNSAYWKRYGNAELFAKAQANSDKNALLIRRNGDLVVASDNGLSVLRNGFWQWFGYDNALGHLSANLSPLDLDGRSQILALAETDDGTLWLGSSKGLMALAGDYQAPLRFWGPAQGLTAPRIASLATRGDQLYAATVQGVFQLTAAAKQPTRIKTLAAGNIEKLSVLSGHSNNLVYLNDGQLWLHSDGKNSSLGQAEQFAWHQAQGILYWLHNGLIYRQALNERNGIWRLSDHRAQIIARQQDLLLSKRIHELAIWQLPEVGDTLVVNTDRAINVLKDNYFEAMPLPYETRRGGLQVGPQHSFSGANGLALLSREGVYTRLNNKAQHFNSGPVYDLLSDNTLGLTFIATGSQILYLEQGQPVYAADRFSGADARILTQDQDGNLITHDGRTLIRFQRGSDQAQELFRAEASVEESGWRGGIEDIHVDKEGTIWATAGSSLFRYANDKVQEFNYILNPELFPSRSSMLTTIYEDLNGALHVVASDEGHLDYQGVKLNGGLLRWNGKGFDNLGRPSHWFTTGYTRIDANTAIVSTSQSFAREKAGPEAHAQRRSFRTLKDPTYTAVEAKTDMLWLGRQGVRFRDTNSWLFPSAGGVVLYHNGKWFYPDRLNQLLPKDQRLGQYGARTVHAVSVDDEGRIYAATDLGVLAYQSDGIASLLTDNQLGQIAFADHEHQQQQDLSEIFLTRIDPASPQGRLLARYHRMQQNIGELEQQLHASAETLGVQTAAQGNRTDNNLPTEVDRGNALKKKLKEKKRVREKLLARIENEHYGLYQMLKLDPREVAAMHKQLGPQQALVQYLPTPDKLLIQVVTQEGAQIREVNVSRQALETASSAAVTGLRYQASNLSPQLAARGLSANAPVNSRDQHDGEQLQQLNWLYEHLLRPVERELAGKSQVFITPVGALTYLPFPALVRQIKPQVEYAVERFNLGVIPSMYHLNLVLQHNASYSDALLMVADPDGSLPGARREVARIAADSSSEHIILEGNQATYANLTAATDEARVMHLATHGKLNQGTPADSYLLLADNYRLNVIDIATLDLDQTDLVVLSACETGIGKPGLEYATLARAFAHANVPTVVASYWKVDDSATASLMQDFYKTLEDRPEQDYFSALAKAQRQMLSAAAPYKHPAAWAGFTVFGKP